MILEINGVNLAFDDSSGAQFTTQWDSVLNDNRQIHKQLVRWTITGRIHPDQSAVTPAQIQASIVAKVAQLEAAVSDSGNTARLLTDDSTVADVLTGAVVLQRPSFGGTDRGENALFRRYTITLESQITGNTQFASYIESIQFSGGGPRKVITELRTGPPEEYGVSQATAYHAVQVGSAINRITPYVNPPLWPDRIIDPDSSQVSRSSKNADGHASSWSYQFASTSSFPLIVPSRPL